MSAKLKFAAVLLSALLTGCVTTGDSRAVDGDQAVRSYLDLARGYIQQGYTERAVKPLNRALEINPGSPDAYGMFGLLYQLQGEAHLAEQSFRKALSLNPDSAEIHNNFGVFLFSQNRLSDAYREFSKAADDVRYAQRSRAFENMGRVALKQGQTTLAQQNFEKSLKLNSNLPGAHLELADLFYSESQYLRAWEHYQAFTQLSAQNERSLKLGVRLARAKGDKSAADSYARQLKRLYPNSRTSWESRSRSSYDY